MLAHLEAGVLSLRRRSQALGLKSSRITDSKIWMPMGHEMHFHLWQVKAVIFGFPTSGLLYQSDHKT